MKIETMKKLIVTGEFGGVMALCRRELMHPNIVRKILNTPVLLQTSDFGETWTIVDGTPVETPLDDQDNSALITDYEAQGKDKDGHPVILYIHSGSLQTDWETW